MELKAVYASAADLAGHIREHTAQGALFLSLAQGGDGLQQFQPIALRVTCPEGTALLDAEILQVMPGVGLAVRLREPEVALQLAGAAEAAAQPAAPTVSLAVAGEAASSAGAAAADAAAADDDAQSRPDGVMAGMGPASWPIEKLLSEWKGLSIADQIQVARYGKLPARRMILKSNDKKLHHFVFQNPGLSAEEVAAMASMTSLDSALLGRIATSAEWTRHTSVARNLICNPKVPVPQVSALIGQLPELELRRLARTGRVREAVKRLILKRLGVSGKPSS